MDSPLVREILCDLEVKWSVFPFVREAAEHRRREDSSCCHALSTAMLGTWFDVDTAADLSRLEQLIVASVIRAPQTADLLKRDRPKAAVSSTGGPA